MKILLIGYNKFHSYDRAMFNGFRYLGHNLSFFPLNNNLEQNNEDLLKIINGQKIDYDYKNLINYDNEKCDITIFNLELDNLIKYEKLIKNIKINTFTKLILFNTIINNNNELIIDKLSNLFDFIFSSNPKTVKYLLEEKFYNNCYHFYNVIDSDSSFYLKNEDYNCDISIVFKKFDKGLKSNKKKKIKNLLDQLSKNKDINFKIFGPKYLQKYFKNNYQFNISYRKNYLVFSNSKINLIIGDYGNDLSAKINNKNYYYYSRLLPQILGCKGLLVSDQDFGNFLEKNSEYIYLKENTNIITLINDVKNNEKKYQKIKINGYKRSINSFLTNNLCEFVINIVLKYEK